MFFFSARFGKEVRVIDVPLPIGKIAYGAYASVHNIGRPGTILQVPSSLCILEFTVDITISCKFVIENNAEIFIFFGEVNTSVCELLPLFCEKVLL